MSRQLKEAVSLNTHDYKSCVFKRNHFHFGQRLNIVRSETAIIQMNFHGQKVNLSFSIENILRDDFAAHRRRTNPVSFRTARDEGFEHWPTNPAVYQCCAVRCSPVYLNCPPNMPTVEGRLLKTSGGKDPFFREQKKTIEEDGLSCKGEEVQTKNGKNFNVLKPRLSSISEKWQFFYWGTKALFERKAFFSVLSGLMTHAGRQKN